MDAGKHVDDEKGPSFDLYQMTSNLSRHVGGNKLHIYIYFNQILWKISYFYHEQIIMGHDTISIYQELSLNAGVIIKQQTSFLCYYVWGYGA